MDLVNIIGTTALAVIGLELAVESIRTWHQARQSRLETFCLETSCLETSGAGPLAAAGQDRRVGMPSWTLGGWSEPF